MTEIPSPRRRLSYGQNVTALRSAFMGSRPTSPPPKSRSSSVTSPRTPWNPPPSSFSTTPSSVPPTMQAIRLQKKYPEVSQEEMFDLINRFKCVAPPWSRVICSYAHLVFYSAVAIDEAISIRRRQDEWTSRRPSLRCSRAANRTITFEKPSKTSASMRVERSSWRIGLRYVAVLTRYYTANNVSCGIAQCEAEEAGANSCVAVESGQGHCQRLERQR